MDEPVEEIERMNSEKLGDDCENPIGISGSDVTVKVSREEMSPREEPEDDPVAGSGNYPSSVGTTKGRGLRKWRRIRREDVKAGSGSVDSSKATKRGLSNLEPNPIRVRKSEGGSLSSTGAVVINQGNKANGSILDPRVVVGPTDSENSEDRSSISSTAASGSVLRNRRPAMVAATSEKKAVNGVKQGKAPVKSKKGRGEREKIEKENSISSSLESDSRTSSFKFVQGTDFVANNGTQSGKVGNRVGENSDDEAQDDEKHIVNQVESGISREDGGELEDLTNVKSQTSATELDPLSESISKLQAAQEALEKEIQKLRELGDESQRTTEEDTHEAGSSKMFKLRGNAEISPHYLKARVNTLKQNVGVSESKLEEVNGILKGKEAGVTELECDEIEAEIEDLFKHKLETEFQYLAISRAVEKLKTDVVNQVELLDELKTTVNVVRDAENNAILLKKQAEKLETRIEETAETEQVPRLQKRARQVTLLLFLQLVLLLLVFVSFILNVLSPNTAVPT